MCTSFSIGNNQQQFEPLVQSAYVNLGATKTDFFAQMKSKGSLLQIFMVPEEKLSYL